MNAILLIIGIVIVIYHLCKDAIDDAKLTHDIINGVSVAERRRRCVNGYYNKK